MFVPNVFITGEHPGFNKYFTERCYEFGGIFFFGGGEAGNVTETDHVLPSGRWNWRHHAHNGP